MMIGEIVSLAWKNLWRHRLRTLITVTAMGGSLFLSVTLVNLSRGSYGKMIDQGVRSGSGHIGVYKEGYIEERLPEQSFTVGNLMEKIEQIPRVEMALPHLQFSALAQSAYDARGALLFGLFPSREASLNPYVKGLTKGRFLKDTDGRQAVIGEGLSRELRVPVGKSLVITLKDEAGELRSEKLLVVGLLATGIKEMDNALIMVNLPEVQRISGYFDQVQEISLILQSSSQQKKILPRLASLLAKRKELVAKGWQEAMPNLSDAIKYDAASQQVILLLLVIIVGIGITNTFLMSVLERTREFGTLMAIGTSPLFLRLMVMTEAFFTGLLGLMVGWLSGSIATYYLIVHGFDFSFIMGDGQEFGGVFFEPIIRASWNFPEMIFLSLFLLLVCISAAFYPAWQAGRIDPVKAFQ